MAGKAYSFTSDPSAYVKTKYDYVMSFADPRVSEWPLTDSPLIPLTYMLTYFLVVWAGPKLMANRKPVSLGHVLTAYNFLLVGLSTYMTYEFFMSAFLAGYNLGCQPVDYSDNPLALRMARVCWVYYFSKYIEVADTIFFILRKKPQQVTFLHVYHHGTMVFNWWMVVKFIAGGASYFHAMLNSLVHVIMYSYYGLSALGPAIQPYLWWKKYVTKIQMTQFLVVLVHSIYVVTRCDFPKVFSYLSVFYAVSMILLFSNFYYHAFVVRRASAQKKKQKVQQHRQSENGQMTMNSRAKMVTIQSNDTNGCSLVVPEEQEGNGSEMNSVLTAASTTSTQSNGARFRHAHRI